MDTDAEINAAIEELKAAMLETRGLRKELEEVKIKERKAHYRLLKARETVHDMDL